MRLGIRPAAFLLRLLLFFAATYALWGLTPFAQAYTHLLAALTQAAMRVTEWFGNPGFRAGTSVFARGEGIYYAHRLLPNLEPPGIPGDWVQANLVLLIPLMLATPAPRWQTRLMRLTIALACALTLQVLGLVVTIKDTWVGVFGPAYFSRAQYFWYGFLNAFFQSFDTQLFPFAIWAGIHLRQLIGRDQPVPEAPGPQRPTRSKSRHKAKAAARAARA